jgi:hypothetical protein
VVPRSATQRETRPLTARRCRRRRSVAKTLKSQAEPGFFSLFFSDDEKGQYRVV